MKSKPDLCYCYLRASQGRLSEEEIEGILTTITDVQALISELETTN